MFRTTLLTLGESARVRRFVEHAPVTRPVVHRFVAGASVEQALTVTSQLLADGLTVTLDRLGEDIRDPGQAEHTAAAYERLLGRLAEHGLAASAEVSVKLSAIGQLLPVDGDRVALENARRICAAARAAGTTVTLDMEDHTTIDSTLEVLRKLRADFPWVGAVLQAYLRRTEQDCRELAGPGSRVRLCKGAYAAPATVAFTAKSDVDASYARCLGILIAGQGYPMVATHDPRMITLTERLAATHQRRPDTFEYQMLFGIRSSTQRDLAAGGRTVRVYLPYGDNWYGYFLRRLAERPANLAFFLRALVGER